MTSGPGTPIASRRSSRSTSASGGRGRHCRRTSRRFIVIAEPRLPSLSSVPGPILPNDPSPQTDRDRSSSASLADRRSALRELLSRQAVLIVVDDADRADPGVLTFLFDLPAPTRALVTTRKKLSPRVSALDLGPLEVDEALALLRAEGHRQSVP